MAKILIVDDEEMERVIQATILSDAGHEILFAADGQAALRLFGIRHVDLVVTDLAMPEMNGLRLIKELVQIGPRVRVLAISGIAADQLDLAQDFGAMRTLFKPVAPQELLDTVAELLDSTPNWHWDAPWTL